MQSLLTAALLATMLCGPAVADPKINVASDRLTVAVSLADLDLRTPEGARIAQYRVRQQALKLCRKFSDSRRISDRETMADCIRQAEHDAWQSLPRLR